MNASKTNKEVLNMLDEWFPMIIEVVKKDLKNDHLKQDYAFIKRYLPGKNLNKIENSELVNAYRQAISESETAEQIAEFIINRWIYRNSEMYQFFESHLTKINPDFTTIERLTDSQSDSLITASIEEYGAFKTYIFSRFNAVTLPEMKFKELEQKARTEEREAKIRQEAKTATRSIDDLVQNHQLEIARITDKYEKKLIGLQKKYSSDIEALKKQVAALQRKAAGV